MTHGKHDLKEAEQQKPEEEIEDEENPTLSTQLLRFHDDLNNFLGEQDFYSVSINALFQQDDCDVLYTQRQETGLSNIGRNIAEKGSELSDRLGAIRTQIRDIGKQLR